MTKKRVFIYGSCVSRDTVALMDDADIDVLAYVARQSLVSAFAPADAPLAWPADLSRFQRRMINGDIEGNLPRRLREAAPAIDLLLWDLTDERLGFYRMHNGGCVTRSLEMVGTELERTLASTSEFVPFGTDEHFAYWTQALSEMLALLKTTRLMDLTVVLAVPWASTSRDGTHVPPSFGTAPEDANALFTRYYSALETHGVHVERITDVAADAAHRWGIAPFHYADDTYRRIITAVEARFDEVRSAEPPATDVSTAAEVLLDPPFEISSDIDQGSMTVSPRLRGGASAGLSFAYYVYDRAERIAIRWYEPEPHLVLTGDVARRATSVTCFVREPSGSTATASSRIDRPGGSEVPKEA